MPDDLQIDLGETTVRAPAQLKRPSEPDFAIDRVGGGEPEEPEVYLHLGAIERLLDHVRRDEDHEVGGILIGQAAEDTGGRYVLATGAVPARLAHGARLCVTFTHEAWDAMLAEKERVYPGADVVGWYHTHPGLGVFLSGPDRFIQQSFFAGASEIALVIDPRTFAWAVFHWHGEELRAVRRYFLYAGANETRPELARLVREYAMKVPGKG